VLFIVRSHKIIVKQMMKFCYKYKFKKGLCKFSGFKNLYNYIPPLQRFNRAPPFPTLSLSLSLCVRARARVCVCVKELTITDVLVSIFYFIQPFFGPPLWSSGQCFWLQIQRSRVRFPALPHFLRSRGSGTGSTQPRDHN
jgi:hypothetical protein